MTKEKIRENICGNLRKLRTNANMKQEDLAKSLNISISSYQKYELIGGSVAPTLSVLADISDFYHIPIDVLIQGNMDDVESDMKELKYNMETLRVNAGLSYEEVADKIGVSETDYRRYECDKYAFVPYHAMLRIADVYHVSVETVVGFNLKQVGDGLNKVKKNLKELREKCGFSVKDTAEKINLPEEVYLRYEDDACADIPLHVLIQLSELYHVTLDNIASISFDLEKHNNELNKVKKNLKAFRTMSGFSCKDVADKIEIFEEMYSRYEEEPCADIPLHVLIRLAELYHITLDEIAGVNTDIWKFVNEK